MADIHRDLADYLARISHKKWKTGELDCGIFLADWIKILGMEDPIWDIRGSYRNERGFMRIIRTEGGFVECCGKRVTRVGMKETKEPKHGDVAAVMVPYLIRKEKIFRRATGAIIIEGNMLSLVTSDLGIVIMKREKIPLMKAWTHG